MREVQAILYAIFAFKNARGGILFDGDDYRLNPYQLGLKNLSEADAWGYKRDDANGNWLEAGSVVKIDEGKPYLVLDVNGKVANKAKLLEAEKAASVYIEDANVTAAQLYIHEIGKSGTIPAKILAKIADVIFSPSWCNMLTFVSAGLCWMPSYGTEFSAITFCMMASTGLMEFVSNASKAREVQELRWRRSILVGIKSFAESEEESKKAAYTAFLECKQEAGYQRYTDTYSHDHTEKYLHNIWFVARNIPAIIATILCIIISAEDNPIFPAIYGANLCFSALYSIKCNYLFEQRLDEVKNIVGEMMHCYVPQSSVNINEDLNKKLARDFMMINAFVDIVISTERKIQAANKDRSSVSMKKECDDITKAADNQMRQVYNAFKDSDSISAERLLTQKSFMKDAFSYWIKGLSYSESSLSTTPMLKSRTVESEYTPDEIKSLSDSVNLYDSNNLSTNLSSEPSLDL